jgi:small neutral amino acid transporter SnatA (MarC family)
MIEHLASPLSAHTTFFSIMNSVFNIPIFLSLIQNTNKVTKDSIYKKGDNNSSFNCINICVIRQI